jgi:NAD(P)-dependent dehydrogenase (short-subunit alcohol dehydrogenase family)
MDLGLKGKHAIVCASSRGLGFASAKALAREGAHVVMNGRDPEVLQQAAESIRFEAPDVEIKAIAGDVTDAGVRASLVSAAGEADILVNNAGGPPPGDFRDWDRRLDCRARRKPVERRLPPLRFECRSRCSASRTRRAPAPLIPTGCGTPRKSRVT